MTSGAAHTDIDGWSSYAVSKSAMERYIQALAFEGHNAWNFEPGVMDTDMQRYIRDQDFNGVGKFRGMVGNLRSADDVALLLLDQILSRSRPCI